MAATKRIAGLVATVEKRRIAKRAESAGLSRGDFIRQAVDAFRPPEDDEALEGLIDQVTKTTARANAALDRGLAFIEASNKRIAKMEQVRNRVSCHGLRNHDDAK